MSVSFYARILYEKYVLREIIIKTQQIQVKASNEDGEIYSIINEAHTLFGQVLEFQPTQTVSINEIIEVIKNSQPDKDSASGLALIKNTQVIAQGGDSGVDNDEFEDEEDSQTSISGMEDQLQERLQQLAGIKPLYTEQLDRQITDQTKVKINILGDEKEVVIDKKGEGLSDVTISWDEPWGREEHNVEFEAEDVITDHGNEGMDMLFTAESSFGPESSLSWEFTLEVYVDASYELSGNIEDWDWNTLEIDKVKNPTSEPEITGIPQGNTMSDTDEGIYEAYGEKTGGNAASNSGNYGGSYGASGEDQGHDLLHEDDEDILEIEGEVCEFCGLIHEGTCGYTQKTDGSKLKTPGGTNQKRTTADVRTNFMRDSRRNPLA